MRWNQQYYVDTRLPFGLHSAPKIFTAVADALQWGLQDLIHYLDDFLFVELPGQPGKALSVALATWATLGVPIGPEKIEKRAMVLTFLGIELDSQRLSVRLPDDKLAHLQLLIDWGDRKVCTKRELLSLIGVLQQAATVIWFGRCFLQRITDLSTTAHELHHHLWLNWEFTLDLQWWALFAPGWNGTSLLFPALQVMPQVIVWSDASGSWGFGACASRLGSKVAGLSHVRR